MITTICLLGSVLALGQTKDRADWDLTHQLVPGLELVYKGTCTDEALSPQVQHQKHYRLEANVLVLESRSRDWHAAMLTALSILNDAPSKDSKLDGPMSVRLELANIDSQGRFRSEAKKLLEIPIMGLPTLESGFLPPVPLAKVTRNVPWEITDENQPTQRWQVVGTESCDGINCVKVVGWQQSLDWAHPRADQTAWRRLDTIWLLPQLNVAQKVERVIEQRDPAREQPTHRVIVRYTLENRVKYPNGMFDDRRQDILKAKRCYDEANVLTRQPAAHRVQIDALLQRVTAPLQKPNTTAYPQAFSHLKSLLENAKKGESLVPFTVEEHVAHTVQALHLGQRAPDFGVSCLTEEKTGRLYEHLNKPVLVIFYNPATPTGKEVLIYAKELSEKQADSVTVMAMAVSQDPDVARKQHQELRLRFPIHDGNGMRMTFGAHQTPRLVLLDRAGYVRLAQTGWGYHTPQEIDEVLRTCEKKSP